MGADHSTMSNNFIHHGHTGANQPSLFHGLNHHGTPKEPRVQAIHSNSEWRKQFNNFKASNELVVVEFTASWCGPCKFLEPAIMELAAKFMDVIFLKVDVDDCMEVSREYEVEAMPTLVYIKQGKEVDRIIGVKKDELEKKIEKHRLQV